MVTEAHRRSLIRLWNAVVSTAAVLVAFVVPVGIVLRPGEPTLTWGADVAVTVLFGLDLILRARRQRGPGHRADGRWWFTWDLLAALPLGRMLGLPAAGLLRLLKLLRVVSASRRLQRRAVLHPAVVRLSMFLFWLVLSAHWLACGWIQLGGSLADPGVGGRYLNALYWSVTTLTTVGYGDITPSTANQTIYTMLVMLLGVGVYGYVIGNVAGLLARMDMARTQYMATLDRLSGFLRYRQVPGRLQRQIHDYHRYVWENRKGFDDAAVLNDLPPSLSRQLSLVLRSDLLKKISFLESASPELVQDLCVKMRAMVFTPGDIIVRAGDSGQDVFFISRGTVEVTAPDGETVLRTLSDGDFFGELALLHERRRSATVTALGYCDLYVLDHDVFTKTLARYPDFAATIRRISEERTVPTEGFEPGARVAGDGFGSGTSLASDGGFAGAVRAVRSRVRSRGRTTYAALQVELGLSEDYLLGVASELIEAERVAVDEGGTVLAWIGDADGPSDLGGNS